MVLCIAIGNSLRGDDGVAHRVLDRIDPHGVSRKSVLQLTPELAAEIARTERVLFIDADLASVRPSIEPVAEDGSRAPLGHVMTAAEVVALARRLYGFGGEAFLCRVPASALEAGDELSPSAESSVGAAAEMIHEMIREFSGVRT